LRAEVRHNGVLASLPNARWKSTPRPSESITATASHLSKSLGKYHAQFIALWTSTRAQIKDPEKVTNKMYGGNTDIPSHFFRIFNLRPSIETILKCKP